MMPVTDSLRKPKNGAGGEAGTEHRHRRATAVIEHALILLGLINLAVLQQHVISGDGHHRYMQLTELLETGRLPDGDYSLVGPLFATPLWLAGRATGDPQAWLRYYNLILLIIGLAVAYSLLHNRVDRTVLRRFLLLVVAGSIVGASVNNFYGEIFTMVCVGCGLLAITVNGRRGRRAGWACVVIGAVNTPASLIGLALVTGAESMRRRRLRMIIPFLVATGLVALEIGLRHGGYAGSHGASTIMPYSGEPGFSYPFVLGLAAIIFSFGRGLLYFIPGVFLPALGRLRATMATETARLYLLWMLFTGGLIAVYMSWWAWHGGMSWGPRFFIIAILPASLAIAVRLGTTHATPAADLLTLAALALSVWGAAASTVYIGQSPPQCYGPGGIEELCHFAPEFSQLWYPMLLAKPQLSNLQIAVLVYYAAVFAWLAAPVAARIARHIKRTIDASAHDWLSRWRF